MCSGRKLSRLDELSTELQFLSVSLFNTLRTILWEISSILTVIFDHLLLLQKQSSLSANV